MNEKGHTLTKDAANTIAKALAWAKSISRERINVTAGKPVPAASASHTGVWFVTITGDAPLMVDPISGELSDSGDAVELWPATLLVRGAPDFAQWDQSPCWALSLPGLTYGPGQAGVARLTGVKPPLVGPPPDNTPYPTLSIWTFVPGDGTGTGGGPAGSAALPWITGLTAADCIELKVESISGDCSNVPQQTLLLETDGPGVWESDGDFITDVGLAVGGPAIFTYGTPLSALTIDGIAGHFLDRVGKKILYEFGGPALCTGEVPTNCNNTFVVSLRCSGCPQPTGSFSYPRQFIAMPGETSELRQYVAPITNGTPPSSIAMYVYAPGTNGVGQFTASVTAPNGEVFQFVAEPPGTDAKNMVVILRQSVPNSIQDVTTTFPQFIVGPYLPASNFSAYTGNPNGEWLVQFINDGDQPITVSQFVLNFGTNANALSISATATPDTGTAPLAVSLSVSGLTGAFMVSVDWGDGSDVEWFLPSAFPVPHTYTSPDEYEIVVQAHQANGAYDEASEVVTVSGEVGADNYCLTGHPFYDPNGELTREDDTTWSLPLGEILTYDGGGNWTLDFAVEGMWEATGWDGTGSKVFDRTAGSGPTTVTITAGAC